MIVIYDQIIIGMFMWMYMLDMHEKGYGAWLKEMEMSMKNLYDYNVHKDYDIACDMIYVRLRGVWKYMISCMSMKSKLFIDKWN